MPVSGTNFGKAAQAYGAHRAGFPPSIYQRLAAFDAGASGHAVVDLGTGTGTLARGFAERGCHVVGIDPDERMLEQARALAAEAGLQVEFAQAKAEATGLAPGEFDLVIAGQCWHWFDREAAAEEALRLLKPTGKLVICHFDWLPLPGNMVEATEKLIEAANPNWDMGGQTGLYPQWLPGLSGGFANIETFSYDVDVAYRHAAWCARIQASAGIAALSKEDADAFDETLRQTLQTKFPADPLAVPHRVSAIVAEPRT